MSKPHTIRLGKITYKATVLQLVEEDEQGRPRLLRLVREEESVKLEGGERFFIVYADAAAIHEKRAKA